MVMAVRRAEGQLEWMDRPLPAADLAATTADLHRLNAWFGGYALSLRAVRRVVAGVPRAAPLRVVDVGGGRGDLAVRLVRWARRDGRRLRVVVLDRDASMLALARQVCRGYPEISLVQADATALPLAEAAVDVIVMALTLHHLEPEVAVRGLAEAHGAARAAVVVNDLLRTRPTLALVWLASRLFGRHRFTHHDGPLSVRRAYSPAELAGLAAKAGIRDLQVRRYSLFGRLVAIASVR